jgi:hypothetical protein
MPRTIVLESLSEFSERQKNADGTPADYVQLRNGKALFSNGASSDGGEHHTEPPPDADSLRVLRITYLERKIEIARAQYRDLTKHVVEQTNIARLGAGPFPNNGWQEVLERLQQEIEKATAELPQHKKLDPRWAPGERYTDQQHARNQAAAAIIDQMKKFPNL